MFRKFEVKVIFNSGGVGEYNIILKSILSYLGEVKISMVMIEFIVEKKRKRCFN